MKIMTARHFGLCFGVRDAIAKAEGAAKEGQLTVLGELAHNPVVHERLRQAGVAMGKLDDPNPAPTRRVMITAHGAAKRDREAWERRGHEVLDATCPLVRRAHDLLGLLVRDGFLPVIIGQAGHVEVEGLRRDFEGAIVIGGRQDIEQLPPAGKVGIVAQTTTPERWVRALLAAVRAARPGLEMRYCDTVCQPTKDRQAALDELISACEIVVVVGGRNSNNTRQLAETVRRGGRMAYHVESAEQLQPRWFEAAETVGLTAGTSTLPETFEAVHARLLGLARAREYGMLEGRAS
jgi:4-hydroxy-3-methylbut-2-enyl diphosphate reductase